MDSIRLNENIVLLISGGLTGFSGLLTLIAISTKGWGGVGVTNFGPAAGLSIISFLLLCAITAILVVLALKTLPNIVKYVLFILSYIASIFMLGAYGSLFHATVNYSASLLVTAQFFCYTATLLIAFWLGGGLGSDIIVRGSSTNFKATDHSASAPPM
ncbi:unnamed protein product [Didymodactylos carnosus]|uniref:Uncharacterized protein n=1 Tax=Didymodactylos carnosus TaxID=1234261 RepID=A0A815N8B1_9BILA|nr:unnamed protein product [Didymodactylos carnosus]CAF1587001.1 unnamed protein product [Didymodactylos carnosus]CAF4309963.1 unnamed protein product [Didymodactylos carnosus]CAF4388875.1 unnamed protein product [Didymodactylos carnosus]